MLYRLKYIRSGVMIALFIFCFLPAPLQAKPFLWKMEDDDSVLFLLGSVHVLGPDHYPLAQAYSDAYKMSEKIVFEADLSDQKLNQAMRLASQLGEFQDEKTLKSVMGEQRFNALHQKALKQGLSLRMMNSLEPWFATMMIAQITIVQAGLSPELGVDKYFERQAVDDGKPVGALETVEQQLRFFDDLSMGNQIILLEETIEKFADGSKVMDEMMSAWVNGETQKLANLLNREMKGHPELKDVLLKQRNRNWVPQIETLLAGRDDVLVVVGAGHLVGPDSVIRMLRDKGYEVTRVSG